MPAVWHALSRRARVAGSNRRGLSSAAASRSIRWHAVFWQPPTLTLSSTPPTVAVASALVLAQGREHSPSARVRALSPPSVSHPTCTPPVRLWLLAATLCASRWPPCHEMFHAHAPVDCEAKRVAVNVEAPAPDEPSS